MSRISGRVIAAALGLAPSAIDVLIRDYHFQAIDRSSNLPGRGRDWSHRDLLRVCLALRLSELGLAIFNIALEIPRLDEMPEGLFLVEVWDYGHPDAAPVPMDARIRVIQADALPQVFERGAQQVVVVPVEVVAADVRRILSHRAREAA